MFRDMKKKGAILNMFRDKKKGANLNMFRDKEKGPT